MIDPIPWFIAFGAFAVVGYMLAATGLRELIVVIYYLIALTATYGLFDSAFKELMSMLSEGRGNG